MLIDYGYVNYTLGFSTNVVKLVFGLYFCGMGLFETYCAKKAEAKDLAAALALMNWDQETYMPAGAAERRAKQTGTLAAFRHRFYQQEIKPLLDALEQVSLNEFERLNVVQDKIEIEKACRLPETFVAQLAEQCSKTQYIWQKAKEKNDFQTYLPALQELITLKRKEAEYYGYTTRPYDALLDTYEPGATTAFVEQTFDNLRPGLLAILSSIGQKTPPPADFLSLRVESKMQEIFTCKVLQDMGFDFEHGRLDFSTHPFTIAFAPEDVRITSHIHEHNFMQMLGGAIHEGGHALYEQGLSTKYYGLPIGEPCSLAIHESQSRVWENVIGKSMVFWQHYFNDFAACFPNQLAGYEAVDVFKAVNRIEPSRIRIMADELTYHFHIILRFELERDLIENQLQAQDLPAAWNEKMQQYLGISPANDAEGCMQDIHWSCGLFGYFPTYTLGSLYAVQFMDAALISQPHLETELTAGNYRGFHAWLTENIYSLGRLYNSETICAKATGKGLDSSHFIKYMQTKLSVVYA